MVIDRYSTVYCYDIFIVINPNKKDLDKQFEWKGGDSIYDEKYLSRAAYSCMGPIDKTTNKSCFVIVFNEIGTDKAFDINTMAHEAFHVTMDILNDCDLQYSDDSCEAYAYLQGYITECIYKTAKKYELV